MAWVTSIGGSTSLVIRTGLGMSSTNKVVRTYRYNTIAMLREPLSGSEREAFIDELTDMLYLYLFGSRDG